MLAQQTTSRAILGGACVAVLLSGCDPSIEGCVSIKGAGVWNAPPDRLLCVLDDLVVEGRTLADLAVLERVEEIAGSLVVHNNPTLAELPPWPALVRVGGSLSISANDELATVRGFPALAELGGGLYIAENPRLAALKVSGALNAVDAVFVALNPRLTHFACLPALKQVERDVHFSDNAGLERVELPALAEVGGDLRLRNNVALREAEFESLRSVAGIWSVAHNPALLSLGGFPALERVWQVSIDDNEALTEVEWTTAFEVTSSLEIINNARLERILGGVAVRLASTTRVTIAGNPGLEDVEGFAGVVALNGLAIEENAMMFAVSGWSGLTRIAGRGLTLARNPLLEGPNEWFAALAEVSDVAIFGNASLEPANVAALLARVTVEGATRVGDNKGESTLLDPCPWPRDGICDAASGPYGPGTGLCVLDWEDCA